MNNKRTNSSTSTSLEIKQKLTLGGIISFIIIAGVLTVLETQTSSGLNLHTTPVCGPDNSPFELDWHTVSWSDGSLTRTFNNVDGSGVNFSFSYSGSTSKFGIIGTGQTPNIQDFFPSETVDALSHYVNPGFSSTEKITLTIDINPAIPANLAFDVFHINGSSYSGDKLSIYAKPSSGGSVIYPSFTNNGSPSWEDEGNGSIDAIAGSVSSNNAYAGVNFNSPTYINQLVIEWKECDMCGGGVHGWGLGNIEFCTSVQDTDGDNILDALDIDDDNDGIPDVEEVCGISSAAAGGDITVEIQLDGYGDIDNTAWTLKNSSGATILSGGSYAYSDNNTLISETANNLPADEYIFEITDDWGDGLCCNSEGYYQLKLDGVIVAGPVRGNFGVKSTARVSISNQSFACLGADPALDSDGDGIVNYKDSDFCQLNAAGVCTLLDTDSDGVPDYLDLDADNDGIPDIVEAGGADANGDGRVDDATDSDGDGLANVFETAAGYTSILFDTDGDGISDKLGDMDGDNISNWLDLDSDGDGIVDVMESLGSDTDKNGQIDNYGTDIDTDGYADGVDGDVGNDGTAENSANSLILTSADSDGNGSPDNGYPQANSDNNGKPNFLDIDADDDGIVDNTEAQATSTYQAPAESDSDKDGIDNTYDNIPSFGGSGLDPVNTDLTDLPDYLDDDSDGDKQLDIVEGHDANGDNNPDSSSPANRGIPMGIDTDGDGLDDGYDNNNLICNPTNSGISPSNHPIADGGSDQDWRAQTFLPVEWVSFQAQWKGYDGILSWETAMELNASHFQVERAIGTDEEYLAIGKVSARGNTTELSAYQYLDTDLKDLNKGEQVFYRLKQIDIDGQFEYSAIVELVAAEQAINMKVYPNPASEFVTIEVNNGSGDQFLRITSIGGKVILQRKLSATENQLRINLDNWAKGIYMVSIEDDKGTSNAKLVVR